jgi:hypothetical protein
VPTPPPTPDPAHSDPPGTALPSPTTGASDDPGEFPGLPGAGAPGGSSSDGDLSPRAPDGTPGTGGSGGSGGSGSGSGGSGSGGSGSGAGGTPDAPDAGGPDAGGPDAGGLPGAPGAPGEPGAPGDPRGGEPGPDTAGRNGGQNGLPRDGWGDLARALEALGIEADRSGLVQVLPTLVSTTGGVAIAMAFMFFGKKRRDGDPPAPDEVLQASAARGAALPSTATLVPSGAGAPDVEMLMPRWRRPSLLEARKADPLRDAGPGRAALSFDHGLVGPVDGHERRVIRYRAVRLLDAPDELRSSEIGFLDQGDEVQLLEKTGSYWLVLCPDGSRGWLHKMTLGDVVGERPSPGPRETWATDSVDAAAGIDDDVLSAFLAARGRA